MAIEFRKVDDFGLAVFLVWGPLDEEYIGKLEPQENGKFIYNCFAEINYTTQYLEQILSKMKELQSEVLK